MHYLGIRKKPMKLLEACEAIRRARREHAPFSVLVSTMSAMFAFDALGESSRRIDSVPLMGGAAGLALGISLAQPALLVVAVDGDASLLMELGGLVTVANAGPRHLIHLLVNNGVQFNGLVNMERVGTAARRCDFVAMALAAGYSKAIRLTDAVQLESVVADLLSTPQLAFVEMTVEAQAPMIGRDSAQPFIPDRQFERMREAVTLLRAELSIGS
jgi:thiamine pyrophosphate-dependent acetolactate synthase large subunit-like protein